MTAEFPRQHAPNPHRHDRRGQSFRSRGKQAWHQKPGHAPDHAAFDAGCEFISANNGRELTRALKRRPQRECEEKLLPVRATRVEGVARAGIERQSVGKKRSAPREYKREVLFSATNICTTADV